MVEGDLGVGIATGQWPACLGGFSGSRGDSAVGAAARSGEIDGGLHDARHHRRQRRSGYTLPFGILVELRRFLSHDRLASARRLCRQRQQRLCRGLGALTKGLALRCFGARTFWGATQWLSKALFIHVKFGPLRLATAWTPAHSEHETLTYGFDVTDASLRASMGDPTVTLPKIDPDFWLEGHDTTAMRDLQDRIEAGERFVIPGAPRHSQGAVHVPITQVPAWGPGLGHGLGG